MWRKGAAATTRSIASTSAGAAASANRLRIVAPSASGSAPAPAGGALPNRSPVAPPRRPFIERRASSGVVEDDAERVTVARAEPAHAVAHGDAIRSEERRVGKEC